jgi:hypothetical protein
MRRAPRLFALTVLGAALALGSCRAPTEITLVLSTDVKCAEIRGTSVTVGALGDIETKPATASSTFCDASSGDLGALVIVPSGGKGDEVAMKVIAGRGRDAASCTPPYGRGCIVARRAIHFLPHIALRVRVPLRAACDGVPCRDDQTCVSGSCVDAVISDPGACSGDGCGEPFPTTTNDAGSDAADADAADAPEPPPAYNDLTQSTFWSTFDARIVSPTTVGFTGAAFDGRYIYFVPGYALGYDHVVPRYDTRAPFAASASWSIFDTSTSSGSARGFFGAAFDGRYVYLVPYFDGTTAKGVAARYDGLADFMSPASWSTFDMGTLNPRAVGFAGAVFDGRYLYLAPLQNATTVDGLFARFDTQGQFSSAASWATFDITTSSPKATSFTGGAFDGRYVYFAPTTPPPGALVARYDTQASFGSAQAWSTFDPSTMNPQAGGFFGAAFDGRYVYFVPFSNGATNGVVTRFDTRAPFADTSSWSTFDTTTVNPKAQGFGGATFDGRYLYLAPVSAPQFGDSGTLARYDTTAPFGAPSSWSTFDTTTVDANAKHFAGAVFDGRYVYLVPYVGSHVVARFDAKSPPSMPKLPGFFGSFL